MIGELLAQQRVLRRRRRKDGHLPARLRAAVIAAASVRACPHTSRAVAPARRARSTAVETPPDPAGTSARSATASGFDPNAFASAAFALASVTGVVRDDRDPEALRHEILGKPERDAAVGRRDAKDVRPRLGIDQARASLVRDRQGDVRITGEHPRRIHAGALVDDRHGVVADRVADVRHGALRRERVVSPRDPEVERPVVGHDPARRTNLLRRELGAARDRLADVGRARERRVHDDGQGSVLVARPTAPGREHDQGAHQGDGSTHAVTLDVVVRDRHRAAEVRGTDAWVVRDVGGRAVRKNRPPIEHDDRVGDIVDEPKVVLDDEHRRARPPAGDRSDAPRCATSCAPAPAAGSSRRRTTRSRGQRRGDRHELALRSRELVAPPLRCLAESHRVEREECVRARAAPACARGRRRKEGASARADRSAAAPTATASSAVMPVNAGGRCNVLTIPSLARPRAGSASSTRSARRTRPSSATRPPDRSLRAVDFPEPFGPMSAVIRPGSRSRSRPASATCSPNRLTSPCASSRSPARACPVRPVPPERPAENEL